jgi:hypothetical protein
MRLLWWEGCGSTAQAGWRFLIHYWGLSTWVGKRSIKTPACLFGDCFSFFFFFPKTATISTGTQDFKKRSIWVRGEAKFFHEVFRNHWPLAGQQPP